MRYEVVNITPEMAQRYLDSNYEGNRRVSPTHVNDLARAMREGSFLPQNGQSVVVGSDGTLYDGQHRMMAIVESGTTQAMLVCVLEDGDDATLVFRSIDGGMKRMASTFIDRPYQIEKAALARIGYGIECGSAPIRTVLTGRSASKETITSHDAVAYFFDHEAIISSLAERSKMMQNRVGKGNPSVYGTLVMLTRFVGRGDLIDEFVADLTSALPKSVATAMVVNRMLKAYSGNSKPDKKWQLGNLLNAYENYMSGSAARLSKAEQTLDAYDRLLAKAREEGRRVEVPTSAKVALAS